jgi:hypothetical protein
MVPQVFQYFVLHPFQFVQVTTRDRVKFGGSSRDAQLREDSLKVENSLLGCGEFLIVLNHSTISTIPRRLPSRLRCQLCTN